MAIEWIHSKKPTVLGIASGAVAGLVAITPAAGFVNLPASIIMGIVSAFVGFYGVSILKHKLGYDDSLDAFGIHGLCGIWGAIATGIFANPGITEGVKGLFTGNPGQVWTQILSVLITIVFSASATLIVIFMTKFITGGLRVDEEDEINGLDTSVHGERAFELT